MKTADAKATFTYMLTRKGVCEMLICISAIILYINTLNHSFTQDDAIVIYDNQYTTQGIAGIWDLFTKDTFSGFFKDSQSQLVAGGRYRPLTPIVFAILWDGVGNQPLIFHLFSVLAYTLLGLVLFKTIKKIAVPQLGSNGTLLAFLSTMLFIFHPIHTEVVANVKGLDETLSLLLVTAGTYAAFVFSEKKKLLVLFLSSVAFLLALLSKESAAPFLVLTPLTVYLFGNRQDALKIFGSFVAIFMLYLVIRISAIGWFAGEVPVEMLNNPFIKMVDGQYLHYTTYEKWASIFWALSKYIQLLFFPHPLTHDYYPRHVSVMDFGHLEVLLALIINGTLIAIGILGLKRKSFISYCIFFFYATIALVSNILFPIGTHLSERFLFIPSVAFCLLLAYGLIGMTNHARLKMWMLPIFTVILSLYAVKTISRNAVWKDDFTLFNTDVEISKNSAKVRNAAGGSLLDKALLMEAGPEKSELISRAIVHLTKAIEIHPAYKNAHLLIGNAYYYEAKYDEAINAYDRAITIDPYYDSASENLFLSLREGARHYGSKEGNIVKAKTYLQRATTLKPNDYETISLLGIAFGNEGSHRKALEYFEKAITLQPDNARAYINLGYAQLNMGEEENAEISFQKALKIDPKSMNK
jgi:protein O-mannosyl-transferase